MNLRDLRYLVAVADHLHYGRAAAACNVSQPTLSTQLKKLEEYLGAALFERTNKSVHLTATGAEIVARARRALVEADAILAVTRQRKGPLIGPLQLGIIPTLGPYLLPWLVPAARKSYPELRLVVHEDLTARLLEQLQLHRLDAAIVALPAAGEGWEVAPLFDEPFWLACPKHHPLAKRARVSEEDLQGQRLLVLAEGIACAIRRWRSAAACAPTMALIFAPPASKRCGRWWRRAWAARCCRPLPWVQNAILRWYSAPSRAGCRGGWAWSGAAATRKRGSFKPLRSSYAAPCRAPSKPYDSHSQSSRSKQSNSAKIVKPSLSFRKNFGSLEEEFPWPTNRH